MRTDLPTLGKDEPKSVWEPYDPSRDGAWDLARAAHLHRRAGFGATSSRLARDVEDGHEASIGRLIEGDAECPDGRTRAEFERLAAAMEDSTRRDPTMGRVRSAWLFRLVNGPHPFRERITLAWHGHYATGARKVADPVAMLDQNEAMRALWDAPISRLHRAMLDSSAMQVWLDGTSSETNRPNENLGREFLELFALGEGAYTEDDVKAAARALTGYRAVNRVDPAENSVSFSPRFHDGGEKTLLGETGRWGPGDVVRIATNHPAAARAIARRLYVTFIDDLSPPPVPLIESLADLIRVPGDVDVRRGLRVVLHSRIFHGESTQGRKVKSPVDFAVELVRSCGWHRPSLDPVVIDHHLTRMGQTLFEPPNVAGWPGGQAWLAAPLLIARANFVAAITTVPGVEDRLRALAHAHGSDDPASWAASVAEAFLPGGPTRGFRRSPPARYVDALRHVTSFPESHLA